jgi:hypothetical protein
MMNDGETSPHGPLPVPTTTTAAVPLSPPHGQTNGSSSRSKGSSSSNSKPRPGRALRQRRRKLAHAKAEADRALQHCFLLLHGGVSEGGEGGVRGNGESDGDGASGSCFRRSDASSRGGGGGAARNGENPLRTGAPSNGNNNNDRTRVLPAVARLRQQQQQQQQRQQQQLQEEQQQHDSCDGGWNHHIEVELAGQLGYVPGNAIRVSCFESHVQCLAWKALGSASSSSSEGDDAQPEEEPSSTASPPSSKRSMATAAAARGGGGVPVAIELYPLAVRDDTTTATPSPMYKHGKVRRRKRHHAAAATATTTTISAGGRMPHEDGTEGEEDVEAVASAAAAPDAAAEEDAADGAADRAPGAQGDAAAVPREDTTNNDHDTNRSNDDDNAVLEPFPTLYWLTHPLLRILVSQLEVEGWGRQLEERLRNDVKAQESMQRAHAHYGAYRYQLLSLEDRQLLKQRNWETALCPDTRGVAGIVFAEGEAGSGAKRGTTTSSLSSRICSVKCLHAHAAHYLSAHRRRPSTATTTTVSDSNSTSQGTEGCDPAMDNGGDDNVVGKWVMELIQERLRLVDDMAAAPAAAGAADEGTS